MSERAVLHEHALHNIRYIREAMERATAFTSIPGRGGFVIGVTAIATSVYAARYAVQPRLCANTESSCVNWLAARSTWIVAEIFESGGSAPTLRPVGSAADASRDEWPGRA